MFIILLSLIGLGFLRGASMFFEDAKYGHSMSCILLALLMFLSVGNIVEYRYTISHLAKDCNVSLADSYLNFKGKVTDK